MGRWVWRTQIQAHLLGQVDLEGRVHDSGQQICQDVPHHVLALLHSHERHPFSLSEPPRNDVHLRHRHCRWPCLFCFGSGHPAVSGLPLWERNRIMKTRNQQVEQSGCYRLERSFFTFSSKKEKPFERVNLLIACCVTDTFQVFDLIQFHNNSLSPFHRQRN